MIKIGITGCLASGKTTASKILSRKKGPLFSADEVVKKLYKKNSFKKILSKRFKIQNNQEIKKKLKEKILKDHSKINTLEKIIHPMVRKEIKNIAKKNKSKKLIFFEIPLLIESNLMRNFDIVIFIKAKKHIRLKRFRLKGGNKKLFKILDDKQLSDNKKIRFCDHVVVNENNLKILKKDLLDILKHYE